VKLVGVHASADKVVAQPGRGVDHELVGSGERVDRERHAGDRRRHHALHQHADARFGVQRARRAVGHGRR
jgi:hypothetical protein